MHFEKSWVTILAKQPENPTLDSIFVMIYLIDFGFSFNILYVYNLLNLFSILIMDYIYSQRYLSRLERVLTDYGLPLSEQDWENLGHENPLIAAELAYNIDAEGHFGSTRLQQLNQDQRHAYDSILTSIATTPTKAQFFIHGPAVTGKTFLYKCICHYYRSQGKIVLCVASSGIAALLLPGGCTAHFRFAIPLQIHDQSVCYIHN
ncbi:PIF1-like helicase-domain-containing protein [Tirmania nivea]|nr:PIF1-like helicase-domain-containing protein [Tirmania nivea]